LEEEFDLFKILGRIGKLEPVKEEEGHDKKDGDKKDGDKKDGDKKDDDKKDGDIKDGDKAETKENINLLKESKTGLAKENIFDIKKVGNDINKVAD
jgi:hypothetical protein